MVTATDQDCLWVLNKIDGDWSYEIKVDGLVVARGIGNIEIAGYKFRINSKQHRTSWAKLSQYDNFEDPKMVEGDIEGKAVLHLTHLSHIFG